MRIVIDMQGAQSTGSWNRGIGRYTMSITSEIVRNRGEHEVLLVLNGAFPESVARIRASFSELLPQSSIHVWNSPTPMARAFSANDTRRQWGELIREGFLLSLHPDIVLVSSLFEGFIDDAVTSIKLNKSDVIVSVILYDLIPLIQCERYLENPLMKEWYLDKVEHLRRSDLWLTISESSRNEGIEHLHLPPEQCINISTDADKCFSRLTISAETEQNLRQKYHLGRDFIMYTGGIDHRKNIEGLIRAYAMLESDLRARHQLAIVCSVQEESRRILLNLAKEQGLEADELILTGFVPEQDLIYLYNLCTLFIFPSRHEGFGLPALEAMRCGAPVIASNTSSLPEVVGLSEALFDPFSDSEIAKAMERVLSNTSLRQKLITHGAHQATKFSWCESARRALVAMEAKFAEHEVERASNPRIHKRPLLAYISPLPPERSGIAGYSAELLPALAKFYEIEVVITQACVADPWITTNLPIRNVEWLLANSHRFDRVLYHFGNSSFHQHMFGLLKAVPGVVVLHDFYLSGILHYMDVHGYAPGIFIRALFRSHGYPGLVDKAQCNDVCDIVWSYPCSQEVIEDSLGTIVHSDYSLTLASQWYGLDRDELSLIPLLRVPVSQYDKAESRGVLGLSPADFVVCSFGIIGPTKLNDRLLEAWFRSNLANAVDCCLIFVGECLPGDYGSQLLSSIKSHPNGLRVSVTGWLEQDVYRHYLAAADLAIQLRSRSRGETSAAVLDCMNYGLPTIVNANGSMADLADDAVFMLPDAFSDQDLVDALELMWRDRNRRHQVGANALNKIRSVHDPLRCAERYRSAIEHFYANTRSIPHDLISSIVARSSDEPTNASLMALAQSIATTFSQLHRQKQLLLDVSGLITNHVLNGKHRAVRDLLKQLILSSHPGLRVEPVYATLEHPYRYARKFTTAFLDVQHEGLEDDPVDLAPGDVFFALELCPEVQANYVPYYHELRRLGLHVRFFVHDFTLVRQLMEPTLKGNDDLADWIEVLVREFRIICSSKSLADEVRTWIPARLGEQAHELLIDSIDMRFDQSSQHQVLNLPFYADQLRALLLLPEVFPYRAM